MAFNPNGVAAFPSPKIFAIIFIEISLWIFGFFKFGNKNLRIGFKSFVNFSVRVVLLAISMIPLHKHNVPSRLIDKFTASLVLSKIELFKFSKLPEKIAKENDIIIKIGQTIFNIPSP